MKKHFIKILILVFSVALLQIFTPVALAEGDNYVPGGCSYFLGMPSWNCGVDIHDEESLKAGIWNIAANVFTSITVIATYLVIGYVIYGGYQYIFSSGDPNKVASGKKTLNQAFIGLAIVISANIIMNSIRIALIGGQPLGDCVHEECVSPGTLVTQTVQWVIGVCGFVSAIFVVGGGIFYITSAGNPDKLQKAKNMIIYALIGMVIVALAEIITIFISNTIRNSNEPTSFNQTKELYEIKKLT